MKINIINILFDILPMDRMHKITVILVILALAGIAYIIISSGVSLEIKETMSEISTEGYARVNVAIDDSTLTFYSGCYELSMNVHEVQALSIKNGLEDRIETRPLTHDIMRDMIENFGIKTELARIESFRDGIYYARIFMKQGSKALDVDARPTDAVGIAVRMDVPIYFRQELLEKYGTKTC